MSPRTSVASHRASSASTSPTATHHDILRVLYPLLGALFAALLSTTAPFPALSTIITDLGGGSTALTWIVTVALLATATSTPIWGALSDLYQTKNLVQLALLALIGGCLVSACAPTLAVLFVGRALQGVGIGGVVTVAVAVLGALIPPRDQGRYSGYAAAVMAASMAGGPPLGGALADTPLGWRACFLVSAPPSVLALLALRRALKPTSRRRSDARIDWLGAALLTAGVILVLLWVAGSGDPQYNRLSWPSTGCLTVGGALLVTALLVERRAQAPVVPFDLLGQRTVTCTIVATVSAGLGFYAAQSFLSEYFHTVRSQSATTTGLLLTPMVLGLTLSSYLSGRLITRFGKWKALLVAGALLQLTGCAALAFVDRTTPLWRTELAVLFLGLGIGVLLQNLVTTVQNTVDPDRFGAAGGAILFFRQIGGAVGLPLLTATLPSHGDGTGRVFLLLSALSVVGLAAVVLLPNHPLRSTLEPDDRTPG